MYQNKITISFFDWLLKIRKFEITIQNYAYSEFRKYSSIFTEPSYKETSHKNPTHENLKFGYKNLSHNFQDTILNIEKDNKGKVLGRPTKRPIHKIFTPTLDTHPHKVFGSFIQNFLTTQKPCKKDLCKQNLIQSLDTRLKTRSDLQLIAHNSKKKKKTLTQNSKRHQSMNYSNFKNFAQKNSPV